MPQLGQDYPGFSGVVQGVSHCFPFSIRDSNGLRQNLQETNENNDLPMNYGVTSILKKKHSTGDFPSVASAQLGIFGYP
jgi:hypothetical protein